MTLVYGIGYWLCKLAAAVLFRYKIIHPERMVERGGVVLAVNHTSYLDPPLVGICSRRDVYFLARKTLLEWPILGPLFPNMNTIPVDRDGVAGGMALRAVIQKIRRGNAVVLFPEGARSRDGTLHLARPGIGLIVAKTLCPVLPMRIFGANRALPFGRKTPYPTRITTVVGEVMHFSLEDVQPANVETYRRISQRVMDAINDIRLSQEGRIRTM
ncbi:MAG: 1-acyl-sn-glycerol-3-phosphate acyltransferase [Candidatus Xiphinematobacter sp.]|nr:MAG: 1-acyl-sn-glycerol-3-phosphate acyltransferase [Candidatus Xiphinematobacter sp.]QQY08801.1 MAG: 1-acyl-sn-glycerol-3-phosphate acyltransferase [Candidatus Xiphinematobacter sp.]QQY09528.1 MAG: 1-acyl-sn-glycerol-3-phosphate acyltransferase [Candidatus Xiphinematobacter sp.]QQY10285.1 MAG: 1-acyl-sn-glycerol-3-phosphate acyltransferase [Candidatus Xiphinematobacter sp.]QQY11015.1 MAG: 1-acyl-sn-glycerol-3-phosphate acyltransferase [Candidatus Xiphinematobacter sp.]